MRSAYLSECYQIGKFQVSVYFDIISDKTSKKCRECLRPTSAGNMEVLDIQEVINSSTYENIPLKSKLAQKAMRNIQRDYHLGCCSACTENINLDEIVGKLQAA